MTMVVVANRAAEQTDPATRQLVRVSPRQVPDDVLDEGIAAELTSIPGTGLGNDRLAGQLVDEHCRGPVAGPRHGPPKPRLYRPAAPLRKSVVPGRWRSPHEVAGDVEVNAKPLRPLEERRQGVEGAAPRLTGLPHERFDLEVDPKR